MIVLLYMWFWLYWYELFIFMFCCLMLFWVCIVYCLVFLLFFVCNYLFIWGMCNVCSGSYLDLCDYIFWVVVICCLLFGWGRSWILVECICNFCLFCGLLCSIVCWVVVVEFFEWFVGMGIVCWGCIFW